MSEHKVFQIKKAQYPNAWNNIPDELKERKQWVLWKLMKRKTPKGERLTKIPFQVNGSNADSMNPETWGTFEQAVSTYNNSQGKYNGIGFVFSEDDPYLGIDIDHCINGPSDANVISSDESKGQYLDNNANHIVQTIFSYTEVSQSGTGVHMIVKAKLPGDKNRKGSYEFYESGRYFVMTGNFISWTSPSIEENQKGVNEAYKLIFAPEPKPNNIIVAGLKEQAAATAEAIDFDNLSDSQIIEIAAHAKNGYKFYSLLNGDWQRFFGSQSEADQAFCNILAFYTRDPSQIDRIFINSGLHREKWDRPDYKNATIEKAISDTKKSYSGKRDHLKPVKNNQPEESQNEDNSLPYKQNERFKNKVYPDDLEESLYKIGYSINSHGNLCVIKDGRGENSYLEPIANFLAWPVKEIQKDNGIEKTTRFEIQGTTAGGKKLPKVLVPAEKFSQMQWTLDNWGLKAVIQPGSSSKDKVRYVIQTLGINAPCELSYGHLGWRKINDKWVYLHAGGAIGDSSIIVDLEEEGLTAYEMPAQTKEIKANVQFSLNILDVAPKDVTIPLFALTYLAPLCEPLRIAGIEPSFVLWLCGTTGSMKSTLAALFLSYFGKFTGKNLPASFKDTANALERKSFFTKDSVLVVDDYHPNASQSEAVKMRDIAERLLRIYGDRTGRGRLNADSTAKKTFVPKGLCLVTGEDHPEGGQSSAARYLGIELEKGDIDTKLLTELQNRTDSLGITMRSYISALNINNLPAILKDTFIKLRERASKEGQHSRIPEVIAWLQIGVRAGLDHAVSLGIMTKDQEIKMLYESWNIFLRLAEKQSKVVEGETPELKFLTAFSELISNNTLRTVDVLTQTGKGLDNDFVGWQDKDWYYLLPGTVYNAVTRYYQIRGTQLPVTEKVLWKHLEQAGFIKVENDGKQIRRTVRRTFCGERVMVLQLRKSALDEIQDTKTTAIQGDLF